MFMQNDTVPDNLEEEFSRPVESIMRCEDFKSNFARRLSNRYISRSPVSTPRHDTSSKSRPLSNARETPNNVPERIEPCSQLSNNVNIEQNGEIVKPPDKHMLKKSDIRITEVTALNMEVETLRWQLAQTEANRQMHIALLKQIVTFLSRVKEHIEFQKNETDPKEILPSKVLSRSLNFPDLPRSRSVLHVNKNLESTIIPYKKISTRKISKSISNVNGYKDNISAWNQSKLSLSSETDATQKITEEISRLITLANTVLSTKLPDLACSCNDNLNEVNGSKLTENIHKPDSQTKQSDLTNSMNLIEENKNNAFIFNNICDSEDTFNCITDKFIEVKDRTLDNCIVSQSPLTCGLENDFADVKLNNSEVNTFIPLEHEIEPSIGKIHEPNLSKNNHYNHSTNFIEDESGFSSMSSFQEIGIPIISIIPPSPCKEMGYMEDIPDIIEESEKWKTDTMELDKQTVKVFWV